jgi:hypothetical protein
MGKLIKKAVNESLRPLGLHERSPRRVPDPLEMPDPEAVDREKRRDIIRRTRSQGRQGSILSDTLG